MTDFVEVALRYTTDRTTNSTLKDDVVVNDEFQEGTVSGIASQNKSLSNPNKTCLPNKSRSLTLY